MTLHMNVKQPRKKQMRPQEQILETATEMFLKKGYGATSIDDIIAATGGSKSTIFKYFANKAGLYEAVVHNATNTMLLDVLPPVDIADNLEQDLIRFGTAIMNFYIDPRSLLTFRNLLAEGVMFPEAARALYKAGHDRIVETMSVRLRYWQDAGQVRAHDPAREADRFLHMIRGGIYEELLLGLRRRALAREVKAHVHEAVALFLYGLALAAPSPK